MATSELQRDKTVICHAPAFLVLDKGKIVQIGTHRQLLKAKDGIYAQLWAHQSDGYFTDIQTF